MTVRYGDSLRHLLFRWKASVWRIVYKEMVVFCILYALISVIYRLVLNQSHKDFFEDVVLYVNDVSKTFIPILSLLLGFYVSHMVSRWWSQFQLIPWPDELMAYAALVIRGTDETDTLLRKTIARYFCATIALAGRTFAHPLQERYPTDHDLTVKGLLTVEELEEYQREDENIRFFLPMYWTQDIFEEEYTKRNIQAPIVVKIQDEMNSVIGRLRQLFCYDWINMPMVYTQVVAIATYSYFFACLIGRQFVTPERNMKNSFPVDYYVPVFTLLQLVFYVGWFKVGQNLMKPFGFDDEDFELSAMLDRHIKVSLALAENPGNRRPPLKLLHPTLHSADGDVLPPFVAPRKKDLLKRARSTNEELRLLAKTETV